MRGLEGLVAWPVRLAVLGKPEIPARGKVSERWRLIWQGCGVLQMDVRVKMFGYVLLFLFR
jgi:hypothetical protein